MIVTESCIACKSGFDFFWNSTYRENQCKCNFTYSTTNFTHDIYYSSEWDGEMFASEWVLNDLIVDFRKVSNYSIDFCEKYFIFVLNNTNTSLVNETNYESSEEDEQYMIINGTDTMCRFSQNYSTGFR